jgi:hypothetical protein
MEKKENTKTYILELTETQLRLLNEACDVSGRIYRGIPDTISLFDQLVWNNEKQRDEMSLVLKSLKRVLNPTHSTNKVAKNGEDQILFDMHQVIRHQFYKERQLIKPDIMHGVDSSLFILGKEPEIKINIKE